MIRYIFCLFLIFVNLTCYSKKRVFIVPFSNMSHQAFFNTAARDDCHKCFCDLKDAFDKIGYKLDLFDINTQVASKEHVLVYNVPTDPKLLNKLLTLQKERLHLFTWEPAVVLPSNFDRRIHSHFGTVFTWADDLIDNRLYRKFYYPQPYLAMVAPIPDFDSKKFAVMIAGNKTSRQPHELYTKRRDAIFFYQTEHPRLFDLYGTGWQGYSSYRGTVNRKVDCLKNYKFCICYENAYENGWITEKIFDCFLAGCLPIYWGAKNIESYIPKNCYIDRRDFRSDHELYTHLKNMDQATYYSYLNNIHEYLESDMAFFFSIEYFIHTTLNVVDRNYCKSDVFSHEQIEKLNRIIHN